MRNSRQRVAVGIFIGVVLLVAGGVVFWPRTVKLSVDYKISGNPQSRIDAAKAAAIERRERAVDQTVWKKEMEAEEHGRVFEDFWDALNAATNKWAVVEGFRIEGIVVGERNVNESLGHGIERWIQTKLESPHPALAGQAVDSYDGWIDRLRGWKASGWQIMQCEFRHNAFDPQTNGIGARSRFFFSAHLTNAAPARAVVEGDFFVEWKPREANHTPAIARVDASRLEAMSRAGPAAFAPIFSETFDPPDLSPAIEPLLVYDLDNDGIPEIALPSVNRLYRWRKDHYEAEKFCSTPRLQVLNGMFVDFDGDGVSDFLFTEFDGVFLLKGAPGGSFQTAPRRLIDKKDDFWGPRSITCGDIDNDGDLDVFVAQYKGPFTEGSMPTPYYDANDGYRWFLFANEGAGNLKDATMEAGLAAKRFRRVYQSSFVDLNGDGALDLLVVSDFAGVDLFQNDGRGHFKDMTAEAVDEPHAFGMGHAFGDFNNDGRLDFYVTGMTSPTADRLEHLGLNRASSKLDRSMRAKMSFGSRLYLGDESGRFVNGTEEVRASLPWLLQRSAARTGWSWGVSAADFDNDGWVDLYVGNGMESMRTVRDYEGEQWLHDMFVGDSTGRAGEGLYFALKQNARRKALESFGGFDKNRLLLNRSGTNFINVAHLFGVALEEDCRNVVATDLDGDGDTDLIVTTQHPVAPVKEKLQIYHNHLAGQGNWIAFSFHNEAGHMSPVGAQVLLQANALRKIGVVANGDSFRSQHPLMVRFGLGQAERVEDVKIRWPGGAVTRIAGPEINRAHAVSAPKRN